MQFSIPQERVPDVKERVAAGAKLPVSAWDSGRTRKLDDGEFLTLDNQIDVQTGTIKAKARFTNAGGSLFPNQFVNVRLLLRTIDAAVVVPVIALRHGPSGDFVYVVNSDHTVTLRNVTAGISGVDNVEITKGLAVGEDVVTEGGDRLKDGARIQTSADRPAGGRNARDASAAPGAPPAAGAPGAQAAAAPGVAAAPGAGTVAPTGSETGRARRRRAPAGASGQQPQPAASTPQPQARP